MKCPVCGLSGEHKCPGVPPVAPFNEALYQSLVSLTVTLKPKELLIF